MNRRLRRPGHATVVAYLALFTALGGASYAATQLPAGSVGTTQLQPNAVTLPKIAVSARRALRGSTGPRGLVGPAGPGAIKLHVDSTSATGFGTLTLGHVGAWTVDATCHIAEGAASLSVAAVGPKDSVMDGTENGAVYSVWDSSSLAVGNEISFPTTSANGGQNADELTLFSPTHGGAHISLFKYMGWTGSALRCKVSGDAYPAP